MTDTSGWGRNVTLGENVRIGENVFIGHNCIIEDDVSIGDDTYVDSNTTIRSFTSIGAGSSIGSNCIVGEYCMDFYRDHRRHRHDLAIGEGALIRSGSIIYAGSTIGPNFQTGHQVCIREDVRIGSNVSIGTRSDIQNSCSIGSYVRIHSGVFVPELTIIDDFVWIFPYVVFTNDPTPPSEELIGTHVHSFAIVAAGTTVLPGLDLGHDCLIGAGSVVTRSVEPYAVAVGNPARAVSDVRNVKNKVTGEPAYPWREHFDRYMPWEKVGFDAWYASLDLDAKQAYGLEDDV